MLAVSCVGLAARHFSSQDVNANIAAVTIPTTGLGDAETGPVWTSDTHSWQLDGRFKSCSTLLLQILMIYTFATWMSQKHSKASLSTGTVGLLLICALGAQTVSAEYLKDLPDVTKMYARDAFAYRASNVSATDNVTALNTSNVTEPVEPAEDIVAPETDDSVMDYLPETQRILQDEAFTYEDMIVGRWLWNNNGAPSAFLELAVGAPNTCAFVELDGTTPIPITYCEWHFDAANEQLKF
jgi:hypothetical protein